MCLLYLLLSNYRIWLCNVMCNMCIDLGSYYLDAYYDEKVYTFDATATINDPGRYINHASRNANLQLMKPVPIGEGLQRRLRIGFVARREITCGEQLYFDYGIRDKEIPWLTTNAKTIKFPSAAEQSSNKWKQNRLHLNCNLCGAKQLAKLSQHLKQKHQIESAAERKKHVEDARKVKIDTLTVIINIISAMCMVIMCSYIAIYISSLY